MCTHLINVHFFFQLSPFEVEPSNLILKTTFFSLNCKSTRTHITYRLNVLVKLHIVMYMHSVLQWKHTNLLQVFFCFKIFPSSSIQCLSNKLACRLTVSIMHTVLNTQPYLCVLKLLSDIPEVVIYCLNTVLMFINL